MFKIVALRETYVQGQVGLEEIQVATGFENFHVAEKALEGLRVYYKYDQMKILEVHEDLKTYVLVSVKTELEVENLAGDKFRIKQ